MVISLKNPFRKTCADAACHVHLHITDYHIINPDKRGVLDSDACSTPMLRFPFAP
jgi:hypothetical protein